MPSDEMMTDGRWGSYYYKEVYEGTIIIIDG
jgi:hypothetical protein